MVKQKTVHTKEALGRKDADVVKHGSGPVESNQPWVMDVGLSVFPRWSNDNPRDSFLGARGKDRPQPHIKVNECDH
jgi:hypothetical protein